MKLDEGSRQQAEDLTVVRVSVSDLSLAGQGKLNCGERERRLDDAGDRDGAVYAYRSIRE